MRFETAMQPHRDHIRYAQCWEDADVLVAALDPQPGGSYLSIASAGDNTLALLAQAPARVVALDLSPAQLACLELRVAGFACLEHSQLLELLGLHPSRQRQQLYQRCRPRLTAAARHFWDTRRDLLEQGIGASGRFERYLGLFRRLVLPLLKPRSQVEQLLRGGNAEQRRAFYEQHWDSPRWRAMLRLFCSRRLLGYGREPAFLAYAQGNPAEHLLQRLRHVLTELDPAQNSYLEWLLTGYNRQALPYALRAENFERIRANLPRLEWHAMSLQSYLSNRPAQRFDGFNLSDLFEYLSPESSTQLLHQLARAGNPGARLAYWNMLVPRSRPQCLAEELHPLPELAAELFARDKLFFYSNFVLEEVRR